MFEIQNIKIGEISNIINTPQVFNTERQEKSKRKISFEDEFNKALTIERNKQLNQFSAIYLKRLS